MERRGRGGEGCGKARGMYSLGNWKEGAGGWRGCGEPEMRERVREREKGGREGAEGYGEVRGSMRESGEMWESGEGRGRSGGRCEGCGGRM